MGRRIVSILLIIFLIFTGVWGDDLLDVNILQSQVEYPTLKLYTSIISDKDTPISDLSKYDYEFSASVEEKEVEIKDVTPFHKSEEGIGYIFLIDVSKSLKKEKFQDIKDLIKKWIDNMSREDRGSILTFGEDVDILQDFTGDKDLLNETIENLNPTENSTRFYDGINKALEKGLQIDDSLPHRKVIISVTDGKEDFGGGITKQETLDKLKERYIPIYGIGVYNEPISENKQKYLDNFGEICRASKGSYLQIGSYDLEEVYTLITNTMENTQIVKIECDDEVFDGKSHRLDLRLKVGTKTLLTNIDIEMPKEIKDTTDNIVKEDETIEEPIGEKGVADFLKDNILLIGIVILIILLAIAILLIYKRRKKKKINNEKIEELEGENIDLNEIKSNINNNRVTKEIKFIRLDIEGEDTQVLNVSNSIVIGRSKECDVYFDDNELSRNQCRIILEEDKFYVIDLDSTNGTLVNGIPVKTKYKLENEDILLIGQTELRVVF